MFKSITLLAFTFPMCIAAVSSALSQDRQTTTADVVVYGGTSGGVMAAVQAARMGKSVILIEPGKHLGGMTSGGLGFVDVGEPATVGGLGREYFHRVWAYYQRDEHWVWEARHPVKGQHAPLPAGEQTMWTVEPSVAEKIFDAMAAEAHVTVVRGQRLDRQHGVSKTGQRIDRIAMESGQVFAAKMFIDATYEGDLMAAAGVSYVVGRDGNAAFNETINGVRRGPTADKFPPNIDPYVTPGDPKSGLLPRIHPDAGGPLGSADAGVQAYNYRLCMTKNPKNFVPFEKPADYDERQYELLFRFIEAGGAADKFLKIDPIANAKTDTNNNGYISTDFVGMSWTYAEADYTTREKIAKAHESWIKGLIWTLQHHPRIPESTRAFYAPWGLAKDEFIDNANWPYQLYIREARRMCGDVVINENTAMGKDHCDDPIGLGSYHMDSHAIKLFVNADGFVSSEGGMFEHIPRPFGISYRAIVPKHGECENLLVPVCASATHAAYGTVRMEPLFMVLGQSAATAACLAIDGNVAVQDVPYPTLQQRLLSDGQILQAKH